MISFRSSAAGLALAVWLVSGQAEAGGPDSVARRLLEDSGTTGGLVAHVGCGDGDLTAALGADGRCLVHGLDVREEAEGDTAYRYRHLNAEGTVTVERWQRPYLPYADGLVNLVVASTLGGIPESECMRVLAPNGVLCMKEADGWVTKRKPWPDDIDEWTHAMHNAGGNAVARDTVVGPPHHVQWVSAPRFTRHHSTLASVSSVVSAKGRLFSIVDEAPAVSTAIAPRWKLVARDAFNGMLLWKQPITSWFNHGWPFRQGPAELCRRLVAVGDRVFVTLTYGGPVTALDAATGDVAKVYDGTQAAQEIVVKDNTLYLVAGDPESQEEIASTRWKRDTVFPGDTKRILAVQADTGALLWEKADACAAHVLPMTLACAQDRVFFQNTNAVVCLDRITGRELWKAPRETPAARHPWSTPTLVAHEDVVLSADRSVEHLYPPPEDWSHRRNYHGLHGTMVAFSALSGERLWECPCGETFHAPVDVFVANGLVWVGESLCRHGVKLVDGKYRKGFADFTSGRDLHTGQIKQQIMPAKAFQSPVHHRCYRNKATDRFLVLGRLGVAFIDLESGAVSKNYWIRGVCQYGVLPCNGLLYVPPHSCSCFIHCKLNGFYALAPQRPGPSRPVPNRLIRGPAYANVESAISQSPIDNPQSEAWPTYRHDAGRSGASAASVPARLSTRWKTDLGGRLSSPVIADGRVLVACIDRGTIHALDAGSGAERWRYTAGGRIDTPPTLYRGLALFGSADGRVTCLRASDGELVWSFLAAPVERRVVCRQRIESAWPVHGSVLVQDGIAYTVAGRSSYLDGGLFLYRLDPLTGKQLSVTPLDSRDPESGGQPEPEPRPDAWRDELPGALNGLLSGDGTHVYMRHVKFDGQGRREEGAAMHLYSPTGLLDDTWWHRTYWLVGNGFFRGSYRDTSLAATGRILVYDGDRVYGYGRDTRKLTSSLPVSSHLFAAEKNLKRVMRTERFERDYVWSKPVPLLVRAMVLADRVLFAAGPPVELHATRGSPLVSSLEAAWEGRQGSVLWAVSADNGAKLSELKLENTPVFDGMAAAGGRSGSKLRILRVD